MELNDKVTQLEDEIKILKNEIQAVLLDLRESYLNNKNPFNAKEAPVMLPPEAPIHTAVQTEIRLPPEPVQEPVIVQDITNALRKANDLALEDTEEQTEQYEEEEPVENTLEESNFPCETKNSRMEEIHTARKDNSTASASKGPVKEWRTKGGVSSICNPDVESKSENIEISVISKLAEWVENSVTRLGVSRTETMLNIAGMMGYIKDELKTVLSKLIISRPAAEVNKPDAKDYLASWLELASILGKDNKPEIALFYILCQESENR